MLNDALRGVRRALVLSAHTDDEFGCAGLMVRLVDYGCQVKYVALSRCEESVPAGLPIDVLERECFACTASIGIPASEVTVERYPVRNFPAHRQQILEHFVALRKSFEPELVLCPSSHDTHQDHAVVYQEGFRAFKHCSILGYELPQNLTSFHNSAFVHLDEETLSRKIAALNCYESQGFRPYASERFIRGLAAVRGIQCNREYAEAFELIRLIL